MRKLACLPKVASKWRKVVVHAYRMARRVTVGVVRYFGVHEATRAAFSARVALEELARPPWYSKHVVADVPVGLLVFKKKRLARARELLGDDARACYRVAQAE